MFNYLLKNLPSKYVFAGYNVRKSLTIMTQVVNDKIVYDIFLYTYLDNYLSFYLLMDDGKYKSVDLKDVKVDEAKAEDLMSKHLFRGEYYDTSEYETYDKEQVVSVFGLRNIEDLIMQVDNKEKELNIQKMSIQASLGIKGAYTGMEIIGIINRFNRNLGWKKDRFTIPALKKDASDTFNSAIGDEFDFFDFMSNKDSDTIVKDLKELADSLDGVGNKKNSDTIETLEDEN